ncbi:unnamed protein product [Danaus chrysippus]|uniref:(African queen) hypothetical protein n=1 Tax=Danaus chrysippus TaxID=151541 RepID=A0A8J2RB97_9NEOP|nr:unnamed protein product [Danaus chrysippus]
MKLLVLHYVGRGRDRFTFHRYSLLARRPSLVASRLPVGGATLPLRLKRSVLRAARLPLRRPVLFGWCDAAGSRPRRRTSYKK